MTRTIGKRRLLGAGLIAVSTFAVSGAAAQPPAAPAPAEAQPTAFSASAVSAEKADFSVQIGETFRLRHDQFGLISEAIASRPGVVTFESDRMDPTSIIVKGVNVGVTQVTIRAKDQAGKDLPPTIRTIQVSPDISYIRSKVAETFPTANLKIVAGGPPGSLIVTGTVESAEDIEPIQTFINGIMAQYRGAAGVGGVTFALRVSGPQIVQLDVCLATVRRDKVRRLGVDFLFNDSQTFIATTIGNTGGPSAAAGAVTGGALGGAGGSTAVTGGNFLFRTVDGATAFTAFVNALREERMGKVLANPTLVCLSGRPARFLSGSEEPYGTAGTGGQAGGAGTGVQFRPVGTTLGFLPVVIGDGKIRLTVVAESSQKTGEISQPNIIAPIVSAQNVGTTVELENGQSIAIGGLIQNNVSGSTNKYPILGELPFVGTLFRSVSFTEHEEETIMIIRVNLVDGMDSAQRCRVRLPGTETRAPTDFELFIEGILEAPRGPRDPFPNRVYTPAWKLDGPFGSRDGECSFPPPVCDQMHKNGHHGGTGNCSSCGTGVVQTTVNVPVQQAMPAAAVQQAGQVVKPEPSPMVPMSLPVEPMKQTAEPTAVPVVPVSEATAVPVVPVPNVETGKAPESTKAPELPVPPMPPAPVDPK